MIWEGLGATGNLNSWLCNWWHYLTKTHIILLEYALEGTGPRACKLYFLKTLLKFQENLQERELFIFGHFLIDLIVLVKE